MDFLKLMSSAKLVLTNSGGIQEETTIRSVPCLTLRENTERPATAEVGSNRVSSCRVLFGRAIDMAAGRAVDCAAIGGPRSGRRDQWAKRTAGK